jgi:hypothetical protein
MKENGCWMMLPQVPTTTCENISITQTPILTSTTSLSDLHDYLHVFDDENGDYGDDEISPSSSHYEINHEQNSTRYIYHSEKINSSQTSSPLNSIGSNWTVEAVEVLMKNMTDPIGKVILMWW